VPTKNEHTNLEPRPVLHQASIFFFLGFWNSQVKCCSVKFVRSCYSRSSPWTLKQSTILSDLTKIAPSSNISYTRNIRCLLDEYPNNTLCLSDDSKSKHKSAYAYSIDGTLVSHLIRSKASGFTAAIFSCLSHLAQFPLRGRFLLLTDSLSLQFICVEPLFYKPSHPTNSFNSSFPLLNRLPNHFHLDPGSHRPPWTRRCR